jgi:hypothetical protein
MAVVSGTASPGRSDGRGTFELTITMSGAQIERQDIHEVVDMRWASPLLTRVGFLGHRGFEAVKMPIKATVTARNDQAIWSRGGLVACMAEDWFALGVP